MDPDNNNNHAKTIRRLQKQIEQLTMDLHELDGQQDDKIDLLCDKLDEMEGKVNDLENEIHASKNGKLIWKIPNVKEATKRARDEEEVAIFSNHIYTGIYGYKLRAVAYLNGIASGKNTHLSLYVMIEKGEFDALLRWPFKQRATFTLLDQNSDTTSLAHRTEELLGDRNSSSFTRPKAEANPGWGFPKFIPLDKLRSGTFLKDDSIFIKIEVEPFDAID